VTPRLGTGKLLTFFYIVGSIIFVFLILRGLQMYEEKLLDYGVYCVPNTSPSQRLSADYFTHSPIRRFLVTFRDDSESHLVLPSSMAKSRVEN
jgi:hypothetical protein